MEVKNFSRSSRSMLMVRKSVVFMSAMGALLVVGQFDFSCW
jgi:hypothetical protein